jgi:RNA polymerase sigma-70 factor (ECF subfamily)
VEEKVDQPTLVARAKGGDEDAWEALYLRAYPMLLAYARRRLGPEPARDAVSEAMARAVARIDRFTWEGGGFDAWLFGILRHVVIDAKRAEARASSAPLTAPLSMAPSEDAASPSPSPLDHAVGAEETAAVRAAFAKLGAFDQEVLELRIMAGLSAEEVAGVMGKRAGAVRMAQSRALDRLRALLTEKV